MADVCAWLFLPILVTHGLSLGDQGETPDFARQRTISPKLFGGETPGAKPYKDELSITYFIDGIEYTLDLRLNKELIPAGHFTRYQKDGRDVIHLAKEDGELCHYKGTVRNVPGSWVALSTCSGDLSGVVYDGREMHYIQKDNDRHILYKHSDLIDHNNNKTCGYKSSRRSFLRHKRGAEVKGPFNSNRQSRYVELVLVADNAEYKEMGESVQRVEQHLKSIANIMNGLYSSLNIFIALVGIVIWTERDEVTFSSNGDTTLTNFLHYRREKLIKDHPNDNAQLLTKFTFEHGVVGKALKGPICTIEYSGGVNTDHSPVVGLVATTIAHEMGHNFGMEHDTADCQCPDDRCIMAPSSSSVPPLHWSSCSLEYLALAFEHGMDYCLRNKPSSLYDSPVCGNGFVEHGEQCDCGLSENCENPCCNATTCMLYTNATCATGECCDLQSCRPKPASTICRSAEYECDLSEYCTGESEFCPPDIYKMDTETCDNGRAYCYNGLCRTHSDQCKLLWGETGRSSDDQCYSLNIKGTRHGNCGYNKLNQTFAKCRDEDVYCGMLHCKHLSERLEFGMESVAILSHSFINVKGSVVPCRNAIIDLGINQIDPGLVPDGAKCGEDKMCVNQKCLSVASLRSSTNTCPNSCNGNGVCNSLGHCHCKDGFAPPFCDYPGFGGSEDSGPTSNPNARKDFVIALFVIFLGIIPAVAIIGFLLYYTKYNLCLTLKTKAAPSPKKPSSRGHPSHPFQTVPSKQPEDNTLLPDDANVLPVFKQEFFGNFKGFSLTPMKPVEPVRKAPPVPALNRPMISSPILENSTCTARELEVVCKTSSVVRVPVRPAPERPLSTPAIIKSEVRKARDGTINRIASFLKAEKAGPPVVKVSRTLDKNVLGRIEISNPIPQTEIVVPCSAVDLQRPVVMRAQSMRGPSVTQRPVIPTFGSMRNSKNKRPVSIPAASRPKSPPPRPPPVVVKVPYMQPNEYDDCLSDKSPTDNIYAVIDEPAVTSTENVSLLGEIVHEIQNRNEESIYSTSTVDTPVKQTYANTSEPVYKVPDNPSIYSNMDNFKSGSSSTTSSGYIAPSSINPPKPPKVIAAVKPTLSTFKSNPTNKTNSPNKPTIKPLTKQQPSGGNLRSRQTTPIRPTNNSPDLVTSCSGENTVKSPDVLITGRRPSIPKKVFIPAGKAVGKVARNNSNVANLQQKFEVRATGAGVRTTVNKK